MKVRDLNRDTDNPRKCTHSELLKLKKNIKEFGSLDGIVYNEQLGKLVSGHQRSKIIADGEIVIDERYEEPKEDGTIARGSIVFDGRQVPYRAVMWDEDKHRRALLIANTNAGNWDVDVLNDKFSDIMTECGLNGLFKKEKEQQEESNEVIEADILRCVWVVIESQEQADNIAFKFGNRRILKYSEVWTE